MDRMWRLVRAVLDFLLPPCCLLCQQSTTGEAIPWVCPACWQQVRAIPPPWCAQCGRPFAAPPEGIASATHRCGTCLLQTPAYDCARAVGFYQGALRDIIHAMKYRGVPALTAPLAALMQAQFHTHWQQQRPDALLPVPLHRSKLRTREFDQALALARHLSLATGVPLWSDVLIRHRPTRSQVGLQAQARRQNIRGAFTVRKPQACLGKALLLIDDVYTTGATVQECARVLRAAGALRVDVYTVARVR